MAPQQNFAFEHILTELLRGLLDTVANQPGLSPERRAACQQATVCTAMAFQPRDPVEAMLTSQCLVYDHMLHDGARDLLRGQAELIKLRARPGILGCGKMFLSTVDMLVRMQARPENTLAFARQPPEQPPAREPAEAEAATPEAPAAPEPEAGEPGTTPLVPGRTTQPLMSDEQVIEILLDGVDPKTQQEIRDVVARAVETAETTG